MAQYLLQVAYTPETWASMVQNPQDRSEAIRNPVEKLGGKIERFWMVFGEYNVIGVGLEAMRKAATCGYRTPQSTRHTKSASR